MASTIVTKNSSTASAVPVAGDLTKGELAVNVTDKKLYTKDNGGSVVKLVGSLGNQEASAVAVTGGAIDGTTVGSTTAAAGAFTTLAASSNVTLSGGTANGVLYLNGSKVATSGSALTFNGTNLTIGSGGKLLYSGVSYGVGIDPDGSGGFGAGYNFETNAGTPRYLVTGPVSGQYISSGSAPFVAWYLGSSAASGTTAPEQMRLTSTGLGIGTSSPANKLDVQAGFISTYDPTNANGAGYSVRFYTNANSGSRAEVARMGGIQNGAGNNGALIFATSNSGTVDERMRLDSSGNLGLGVTPSATTNYVKMQISGSTGGILDLLTGSTRHFTAYCGSSATALGTVTNTPLLFQTNDTERARIDSSGNLLVGTTSQVSSGFLCLEYAGNTRNGIVSNDTDTGAGGNNVLIVRRNGTQIGSISTTTTATAYNTSSDYRLKDNQQPLTGSGAFIDALQPKTWDWKVDGSRGVGFIAHEVQSVSPSSVVGEKDAVDAEGKPEYQAMEYGSAEFIANIIAELQSLRKRVAQLESN